MMQSALGHLVRKIFKLDSWSQGVGFFPIAGASYGIFKKIFSSDYLEENSIKSHGMASFSRHRDIFQGRVSQGKFSNWTHGRRGRVSFLLEPSTNKV